MLSHSSYLFSERIDVFYQSSLQWLARQEKCKADGMMQPWPGQAGVEGLGCLRAINLMTAACQERKNAA